MPVKPVGRKPRKSGIVLTSSQWDEVIRAIKEARDLMGNYMDGTSAESDPDDWAKLSANYAKWHQLVKEIETMKKASR